MKKNKSKILLITEDFPSGLNGTSVKTRNTLLYLLNQGFIVDVCCFHFDTFKVHALKHKNLHIQTVETTKRNKKSFEYLFFITSLLFSFVPITLKRLFNEKLSSQVEDLVNKNHYDVIFFDGYSTLQYLNPAWQGKKIYIDDEDFTDLFRQRFILEKNFLNKLFFFVEYCRSLIFEKLKMSLVNQIWAISPKTCARLKKISGVKTVLMPTIIPLEKNLYRGQGKTLIFTGTLNWRENVEALEWFIKNHWPNIVDEIPAVRLKIIGQGASDNLINFLKQQKNVEYLGYAKDLSLEYKNATLAISPVLINAGIKVKTLTYLSYGLPVVSSVVAAWGLVSTKGVILANNNNFGKIVIKVLENSKLLSLLSKSAQENIRINYSEDILGKFLKKNLNLI